MANGVDPYMVSTFVLAGIIVALGVAFLMRDKLGQVAALKGGIGATPGFSEFAYVLILFLPHVLMFFGPIADALNREMRYTIPSLAAFVGIFANWGLGGLFRKISDAMKAKPPTAPIVGGALDTLGCHVPGFENFVSEYSSAPMVVTFTLASYYLIDLWQNRGFSQSVPTMIAFLSLSASQFWILKNNGCFASFPSVGTPLIASALIGLAFGGTTYGIVKSSDPGRLPSAAQLAAAGTPVGVAGTPPPPTQSGGGGGRACAGGKCTAPADDDQFVCDTYINGMPV